jgi:hypothetical protein
MTESSNPLARRAPAGQAYGGPLCPLPGETEAERRNRNMHPEMWGKVVWKDVLGKDNYPTGEAYLEHCRR